MLAAQLLLSRGANVNARDDAGRTAFSYASEMHCNDVVQLLIRNNVDPDVPDNNGPSPLRPVRRWSQLPFDVDSTAIRPPFDSHSTARRLRHDHCRLRPTSGLLHCGLNK